LAESSTEWRRGDFSNFSVSIVAGERVLGTILYG